MSSNPLIKTRWESSKPGVYSHQHKANPPPIHCARGNTKTEKEEVVHLFLWWILYDTWISFETKTVKVYSLSPTMFSHFFLNHFKSGTLLFSCFICTTLLISSDSWFLIFLHRYGIKTSVLKSVIFSVFTHNLINSFLPCGFKSRV